MRTEEALSPTTDMHKTARALSGIVQKDLCDSPYHQKKEDVGKNCFHSETYLTREAKKGVKQQHPRVAAVRHLACRHPARQAGGAPPTQRGNRIRCPSGCSPDLPVTQNRFDQQSTVNSYLVHSSYKGDKIKFTELGKINAIMQFKELNALQEGEGLFSGNQTFFFIHYEQITRFLQEVNSCTR